MRVAVEEVASEIKSGTTDLEAPAPSGTKHQQSVRCRQRMPLPFGFSLSTVDALLDATSKRSLTSLEQALVALPAYRAQIEAELRALSSPPPKPDERIFEWRRTIALAGRRLTSSKTSTMCSRPSLPI